MIFLNKKNSRGESALDMAIHHDHFECVQLLCAAGAEWDIERKNGEIKLPPGDISNFFSELRTQKRYVQEFDLFARFLSKQFEEAKSPQTIAKECRIYLLEFAVRFLRFLENSPREVERMRQIVSESKFVHCSPKKEYGTHHSTHLFYKMCDSLIKGDKETFENLFHEICKSYPQVNIESYHMKTLQKMENFNLYSSIPEVKKFGDELLWINCLDQKISLAEQKSIMKEALMLIGVITMSKNSPQLRLEELARLKTMLEEFPVLHLAQNNGFFKPKKIETLLSNGQEFTDLYTTACRAILNRMSSEEQQNLPGIFFRQMRWGFCDPKIDDAIKNDQIKHMRMATMRNALISEQIESKNT